MMIRNIANDIVRRRLWPIPLAAVVIAGAAPVLFLHSADPAALPLPTAPPVVRTPASLADLLAAPVNTPRTPIDKSWTVRDPFQAPAAFRQHAPVAGAATATSTPKAIATPTLPLIVVTPKATTPAVKTTPVPAAPVLPSTSSTPVAHSAKAAVDMRYGPRADTRLERAVPRLQPFLVHGKVAAQFIKYSPSRDKALFAIAPDVVVVGKAHCRHVDGVCRYIALKAGSHVRLMVGLGDGMVVSRRLDVVHIRHHITPHVARISTHTTAANRCTLSVLMVQLPSEPLLSPAACATADARQVVATKLPLLQRALQALVLAKSASVSTR